LVGQQGKCECSRSWICCLWFIACAHYVP
jgi:hypothetical protein